ncbi:MAG: glutathione S-transferase family protein [Alphaproteobacteria bacterium]
MAWTFYYSPGAASLSSHIALEEAGAQYEPRVIKLSENEQRKPEYLAINPRGRVPALALEDGTVITEASAVLLYIAQQSPQAKLWPQDPLHQAQVLEWLGFLASQVHIYFQQVRRPMRFAGQNPDVFPKVKTAGMANLRTAYEDMEKRLSGRQFAVGDALTIADLHLFVFFNWGRGAGFVAPAATPNLMRCGLAVGLRPAVERVAAMEGIKALVKDGQP